MARFFSIVTAFAAILAPNAHGNDDMRTLYHNANVHTVDTDLPRAEAFVVEDGRFVGVGTTDDMRALAGAHAQTVDLEGRTVLPGLNDAHCHLDGLGEFGLGLIDLTYAESEADAVQTVAESAEERGGDGWVVGGRWDHESWPSKKLPTNDALSEAIPDRPVYLRRVDGHAALVNDRALELAGVDESTPDPPGGEIVRDASGEATGVLVDRAMDLVSRKITGVDFAFEDAILRAQEMCFEVGLTSAQDMGLPPDALERLIELERSGALKLRTYALVSGPFAVRWFDERGLIVGDTLTIRAAKMYSDGAMGSRGAWLLAPYADRPTDEEGTPWTGLALTEIERIEDLSVDALEQGYQMCVHAIGDRANREVLDAFESAFARTQTTNTRDRRFRVEHAQLLHPADIPRFGRMGVIASMQPRHCVSDMRWMDERVGPARAEGGYAFATLLRSGAVIASGSDFPVGPHDPMLGFHAAVTRQNAQGLPEGGWNGDERMTREEALRSFTLDAAYASFEEESKGSITPGKLADFVVLDTDIMTCDPLEILDAKVLMTVVGGEAVYERE